MGAFIFANNVHCGNETTPIYGLPVTASPTAPATSVLVGFNFDVDCGPVTNEPPPPLTDTHGLPRRDTRNQQMAAEFFATGTVTDRCDGLGCS